jgi:hypothetical protein
MYSNERTVRPEAVHSDNTARTTKKKKHRYKIILQQSEFPARSQYWKYMHSDRTCILSFWQFIHLYRTVPYRHNIDDTTGTYTVHSTLYSKV